MTLRAQTSRTSALQSRPRSAFRRADEGPPPWSLRGAPD